MFTLLLLLLVVSAAAAGTFHAVATDGYRRVPTDRRLSR
jgi:hypothetical protein